MWSSADDALISSSARQPIKENCLTRPTLIQPDLFSIFDLGSSTSAIQFRILRSAPCRQLSPQTTSDTAVRNDAQRDACVGLSGHAHYG